MELREEKKDPHSHETVLLTREEIERLTQSCAWADCSKSLTSGQDCLSCEYKMRMGDKVVPVRDSAIKMACDNFCAKTEEMYSLQ